MITKINTRLLNAKLIKTYKNARPQVLTQTTFFLSPCSVVCNVCPIHLFIVAQSITELKNAASANIDLTSDENPAKAGECYSVRISAKSKLVN